MAADKIAGRRVLEANSDSNGVRRPR